MDNLVQHTLDSCITCQVVGKPSPPEPLQQTDFPKGTRESVHTDFCRPLSSGDHLLVVIDRYSRFPETEIVRSTKTSTVIPKLDKIFSVHGIPRQLKTDNGPPFSSEEFARYVNVLGINHKPVTPY
ncbi:uncharacterized protein K02A2.6-like [Rhopilema esculentum]|uniref:uncharacterized protein K02A2.6-like n=1 Tax=Rhopilema esculentum TaxID=499914 RepID=UPI0031DCDF7C